MAPIETVEQANRYAEAAMATMARLAVAPTPNNYLIWFNHCAGSYPELSKRLRAIEREGDGFSGELLSELHERFFGTGRHARILDETCQRIEDTMSHLLEQVTGMSEGTGAYGNRLSDFSDELGQTESIPALQGLIGELLRETRQMQDRARGLESNLGDSTKLIERLRGDLAAAQREANTDSLTGIANRKFFDHEIRLLAEEALTGAQPLTLLLADIDHFKQFNDTYGHPVGDQVLRLVAQMLMQSVKGRDLAARYGGEEFAVLLPQTSIAGASKLAEQIRVTVATNHIRLKSSGQQLGNITLSIGCAEYYPGEPLDDLIRRADEALYRAKRNGRNQVSIAPPPRAAEPAA